MTRPERGWFARDPVALAPALLGAVVSHDSPDGRVSIALTEVEAYRGADDPGAHSFRGPTARNATMFGEAGHLYCYLSYGIHRNLNIVAGGVGEGYGVLLRAGRVTAGLEVARARRERTPRIHPIADHQLARGPGNLGTCFAATLEVDGDDLLAAPWAIELPEQAPAIAAGPRVGVSGPGGDGASFPWRFWVPGEPSVSAYRASSLPSR